MNKKSVKNNAKTEEEIYAKILDKMEKGEKGTPTSNSEDDAETSFNIIEVSNEGLSEQQQNKLHRELNLEIKGNKSKMLSNLLYYNKKTFEFTMETAQQKRNYLRYFIMFLGVILCLLIGTTMCTIDLLFSGKLDGDAMLAMPIIVSMIIAIIADIFSIFKLMIAYLSEDKTTDLITIISNSTIEAVKQIENEKKGL